MQRKQGGYAPSCSRSRPIIPSRPPWFLWGDPARGERVYYSITEAAQVLGVSRVSIWRWIRDGRLSVLRVGQRTTRIRRQDVDRLLSAPGPADRTTGAVVVRADDAAPRVSWPVLGAGDDVPPHLVHFYEADTVLLDALSAYIGAGLRAGEAGIVIATPAHRAELEARLQAQGLDMEGARATGQYVALDAADTLARILVDGRLGDGQVDAMRFAAVVGGLIASAAEGRPRVRAFGEMVALLVAAGKPSAALALEALWNELQQTHAFTLFCAYPLASLDGAAHTDLLGAVCAAHGHVIPAESYTTLPTVGARLSAIAALQQQARSLQAALAAERAARAAAEEALRVRDEFLSIAAHELRTPLTSLSGQTQLLLRRLQRAGTLEPAQLAQALELMQGQSERLARLMSHLLDHARLEAGKLALERHATDVVVLVQQVVATARTWSAQHPISVVAPPLLEACVDPLRLEQVLTNLLDNAVKYSPEGGPIEVVVARSGAATVDLAVRDHGLGIPVEKRAALFERFYQAHRAGHRGGLGLGLYVSRQIVELHGGTIRAEFPAEGGTRFVVRLPVGLDRPDTAEASSPSATSAAR